MTTRRSDKREFDLVLYGATGFVGELTAKYLAEAAPPKTRIAIAGRNPVKLKALLEGLPASASSWGIVTADASDADSLREMARRARVVVTTVGPYAEHGLPLVLACADAGTDYADLTGEPLFVRDSIDAAHERAAASGARIVHSCGFDSVPSDLSVYATYLAAEADGAGELTTSTLVAKMKGGLSGGTIASGRGQLRAIAKDRRLQSVADDPYSLSTDPGVEPDLGSQSDQALERASNIHPSLKGWVATFLMAPHNTRIVRRSNALLDWAYGKQFRYREVHSMGSSATAPLMAAGIAGGMWAYKKLGPLAHKGPGSALIDRIVPEPGTGPSEAERDSGFFSMTTFTRTTDGSTYRATFAADGDPGYKATAVILGQVGLCLALDREELSDLAGVLTPAPVMALPLMKRLKEAGTTIEVTRI